MLNPLVAAAESTTPAETPTTSEASRARLPKATRATPAANPPDTNNHPVCTSRS